MSSRVSEWCKQTSEWKSEWLSTHVPILGCFGPKWADLMTKANVGAVNVGAGSVGAGDVGAGGGGVVVLV